MKQSDEDPIDAMARAYREEHDGRSPHAAATKKALLEASDARSRRGLMLAAAAALMLVSIPTAWALYTGRLSFDAPSSDAEPHVDSRPARVEPVPEAPEELEEELETNPPITITETAITEAAITETAITEATTAEATTAEPREDVVDPAERRAYEAAHALHFEARDSEGSLAAWDRYLLRYPRGRFAPEARYNRALTLVRLDRREEAIEALRPFARGGYRHEEAQALLEALGAAP